MTPDQWVDALGYAAGVGLIVGTVLLVLSSAWPD